MHESSLVKIRERVEDRVEHFSGLGGRERTLGKNLGEVLFGIFRHDVELHVVVDLTTSCMKQPHQVRMRQGRCRRPAG